MILPVITDILTAINIILVFGSAFLIFEILMSLRKGSYVLAEGLWFFLPAVVVIAVVRVYDFFSRYNYTPIVAFVREALYLVFTALLFGGLLVQFLTIRGAIEKRM